MSNAMKASLALGATAAALGGVAYVSGQRKKSKEAAAAAAAVAGEHARQQQVVSAMILDFENFGQGLSEEDVNSNSPVLNTMETFKNSLNRTLLQIATAINEDPPNYPAVTQLQTELQGTINTADTFLKQTLTTVPQSSPLYAKISSIAQKVAYVAGASLVVYAGYNFLPGIMSSMASWFQTSDSNSNGMSSNPAFATAALKLTGVPLPINGTPDNPWSPSYVPPSSPSYPISYHMSFPPNSDIPWSPSFVSPATKKKEKSD
jgi:hypothetical protein